MTSPPIIFDLNGVLADDESLHEQAFRLVLGERGHKLSVGQYQSHFAGRSDDDGAHHFLVAHKIDSSLSTVKGIVKGKSDAYRRLARTNLKPHTDGLNLVRRAKSSGHKVALVTSANRSEVEFVLGRLGLTDDFDVIVSSDDVQASKPSPEPFMRAAAELHEQPNQCVAIEDSPAGVSAAVGAGMRCIAVLNTHDARELSDASLIVDSLDDVLESDFAAGSAPALVDTAG